MPWGQGIGGRKNERYGRTRLMALIHRFFCMMVLATFSYNTRLLGVWFLSRKTNGSKKSACGAVKKLWFFPKKFAAGGADPGGHGDDAIRTAGEQRTTT
jgi:hypothetical protein